MNYRIKEDIELTRYLLGCSLEELSEGIGVSRMTLHRWNVGRVVPSESALSSFYEYAFSRGVRLNQIKAQLYREDVRTPQTLLFHGSKSGIEGNLRLDASRRNTDFGQGFYCGETLDQAAMFVSDFDRACLYMIYLDSSDMTEKRFVVDQDWMLTIALFRGRLSEYAGHPRLIELMKRVDNADIIVAPIADNRMYEVIDSFIAGEITDEQCRHCLSPTDLGNQYVLRSKQALEHVLVMEKCFLCPSEKRQYMARREESSSNGIAKAKAARRQYRGQGLYIDEVFS